jgi:hypothetical protein
MKRLHEETLLSTGNATTLMVFIDLATVVEKQRGMLSVAFPKLGNKGVYSMLKGMSQNQVYTDKKEQLIAIAERFYNNGPIKALYKTLAFLVSKEIPQAESDKRMQDINRVLSKIERMINGKLTSEEREMFSQMEDTLDSFSDNLNSNLNTSITSTVKQEEPPAEEPEEKPEETPEEKPTETPAPAEKPTEAPAEKPAETPKSEEKPEEKPAETPAPEEKPEETPKPEETEKTKTEESFRRIVKRLVRESLLEMKRNKK